MTARPPIMVMHATGSNRDRDVSWALELAGGAPEIVHINQLIVGDKHLADYRMLVLPGGFSNGDDLGAGKLWAVALQYRLREPLLRHVEAKRPILGICNGFQALVKSGLLPGEGEFMAGASLATLTRNERAHFECRWVTLEPQAASPCVFTSGLTEPVLCPVAHGEGRFVARDEATLAALEARGGVALRYSGTGYPANPNGSANAIAGICNPDGTIFGLMPHPENHVRPEQHPHFTRGRRDGSGLALLANGIRYAGQV